MQEADAIFGIYIPNGINLRSVSLTSGSVNDITLIPIVEEQVEVMKWFFIGEPQSKNILEKLSEKAAIKLDFDVDQTKQYSVEYSHREPLSFQIRKVQFEACVGVLSP